MTKARDWADIAGAVSGGKIANSDVNVSFENIVDTGTEGTKVAVGTTAQRGTTAGQWRYNTTTGFFEGVNTNGSISSLEPDPTISSVDDTEVDSGAGGNQTFVITGTNFTTGGTISFIGNDGSSFNATSTTHNSTTQQTAVVPKSSFINSKEPYDVKYTSITSKVGLLENVINVDNAPAWQTASGTIATIPEDATGNHATVSATDADGDTVAYSLQSGSLGGLSLNSSTGVISGNPTDVTNATTYSPIIRATAGGKTSDRTFNIIVHNPTTGGTITTYTYNSVNYKVHTFTSSGTFGLGVDDAVDIFVLGGGGSGGGGSASNYGSGGGSGGLLWRPAKSLTAGNYTITVGNGGAWTDSQVSGNAGADSIFTNGSGYTLTGKGGGPGSGSTGSWSSGGTGGSGGGAGRDAGSNAAGGTNQNNSEDGSAYAYGNAGGQAGGTSCTSAGGGGGTGEVGHNGGYDCQTSRDISAEQSEGGDGVNAIQGLDSTAFSHFLWAAQVGTDDTDGGNQTGALLTSLSSRPSVVRIGGGGGGGYETDHASQLPYGGKGGGGRGGSRYPNGGGQNGYDGYANTGSGGGAGQRYNGGGTGGAGGKGVVIIRYPV